MSDLRRILVTGGCGFIGSHLVQQVLDAYPDAEIVNLDALTYAGNPRNVEGCADDPRYRFVRGDVCDPAVVRQAMDGCDAVLHLAAETHVDRSLLDAQSFVRTDVQGTAVMLAAARDLGVRRFVHMSTDEVYGEVAVPAVSNEEAPIRPRNPYAASKAGAEFQCFAFHSTYALPVIVARGANAYGPRQFPEKLIPLFVTNALHDRPLPVYGDGKQQRDWIHVDDMCSGLLALLEGGEPGGAYNISAENVRTNIDLVTGMLDALGKPRSLIQFVRDRDGHDRRYASDASRLRTLGWAPSRAFDDAFVETVQWFRDNADWWAASRNAEFEQYYERQYGARIRG